MVVVIDPGHGGKDPGAVNKSIREKDVVLGIGLKLGKYMNENFPDVKVIFTRNTDVFVPLIDRSRIANKNKANLFISIHANFCGTPATRGTETFFLGLARSNENLDVAKKENSVILLEDNYASVYEGFDPNSSESYIMFETVQDIYMRQSLSFADDIQHQFKSRIESPGRGVKQAGFLVLRMSSMPSVLVESGFISNKIEANYLSSEDGQRDIAMSIIDAFRKFKAKNSGANISDIAETKSIPADQHVKTAAKSDDISINVSTEQKQDTNLADKPLPIVENPSGKQNSQQSQKSGIKQSVAENPVIISKKTEPKVVNSKFTPTSLNNSFTESNAYYSVQIGASTTSVEPVTANFKGLKNVRREKSDKYYRYYVGKEISLEKITPILQQCKLKFPQAFIVSFINGERIIINTGFK